MVQRGFLKETYRKMLLVSDNIENLLNQMRTYVAPAVGKWIERDKT
jgi:predicted Rossmann-fold nucleotide-binding protein